MRLKVNEEVRSSLEGLSRHDMLVQLIRAREGDLMETTEDYGYGGERFLYKQINADAVAYLIEEVLALVGPGSGD